MKPLLHIAFDTYTIQQTIQLLHSGIADAADVVECGGPLIFNEGVRAITAIKKEYPQKEIVADIKMIPLLTTFNAQQFFDAGADSMIIFGTASLRDMTAAMRVAENAKKKFYVFVDLEPDTFPSQELLALYQKAGVKHVIYHTVRKSAPYWMDSDVKCVRMLLDAGFHVSVTGKLTPETIRLFAGMPLYSFILGTSVVEAADPIAVLEQYRVFLDQNFS